jgi:hypothetical protein
VIVRIATETQYQVPDEAIDRLNALDDEAQQACEAGDEGKLQQVLGQMAELVRTEGSVVPDDELVASDVIIPPPDSTLEEVGTAFEGEGLIPD